MTLNVTKNKYFIMRPHQHDILASGLHFNENVSNLKNECLQCSSQICDRNGEYKFRLVSPLRVKEIKQ